jgi:enoyl-CoA hydratase
MPTADGNDGGPRPPEGDWLGTPYLTFRREGLFTIVTLGRREARTGMTPAMYVGIRYAITPVNACVDRESVVKATIGVPHDRGGQRCCAGRRY